MDLYARVNILDGCSVRLPRGNVDEAITLDNDPVARANSWVAQGADHIHVVDLDAAARDDYRNRDLIRKLVAEVQVPVQVAGGVRSEMEADRLISDGAWRVVMGTAAIENQNMVWELCREHPGKVAVELDVHPDEEIVTHGWTKNSGRHLEEALVEMSSAGVAAFLIAEAGRDALVEPPDYHLLETALGIVAEPVIAAGGVRNLEDLSRLVAFRAANRGVAGVVVGREVTHGRFSLEEARQVLEAPIPVPVQEIPEVVVVPALRDAAESYRRIADQLDRAAGHARVAAQHFLDGQVPRGTAHSMALSGHLVNVRQLLDERAVDQAKRSTLEP